MRVIEKIEIYSINFSHAEVYYNTENKNARGNYFTAVKSIVFISAKLKSLTLAVKIVLTSFDNIVATKKTSNIFL